MSIFAFFSGRIKLLAMFIATISLCANFVTVPVGAAYALDVTTEDLHNLANQEREKAGLVSLNLNANLSEAAKAKAEHMMANNYWDHYAPDGTTPWSFIVASGYEYKVAGENLAKGFSYSSDVVNGWMNSPTHKANVLHGSYTDVGYAVLNGTILGEETTLVVAMYGVPKSDVAVARSQAVTKDSDPSQVKGVMSSLSVSAYISTSKDIKLLIMLIGVLVLFIAIRFLLFKTHSRRGYSYAWFKKRPIFGSVILLVSFLVATASSLGFALL